MRYLNKILLILWMTLLTGCSHNQSFIQNRDTDYLKAKSVPPLSIPHPTSLPPPSLPTTPFQTKNTPAATSPLT